MSSNKKNWVGATDGQKVWAVNTQNGETRQYARTDKSPVVSCTNSGEEIAFVTADKKMRTWNPNTGSTKTFTVG